nr:unnamed protein product [Callosobruchus analis]
MNSAEMFDISTNQWSFIPQMQSARSGVSLIAFGNTLYAMGGFNGYTRLATGEKFTPDTSAGWSDIAEMLTPRSNFATVILDDYIFVIGGFNDRFASACANISNNMSWHHHVISIAKTTSQKLGVLFRCRNTALLMLYKAQL